MQTSTIHPFNVNSQVTLSTLFNEGSFDADRCEPKDPVRLQDTPLRVAAYVAGYETAMLHNGEDFEESLERLATYKSRLEDLGIDPANCTGN